MAMPTYTHDLDTMVSTAVDTYSTNIINALTDSGEKFLTAAASKGRVMMVNDATNVRHPILYDHGEASSLYVPDTVSGTPAVNNLSTAATEVLTHSIWELQAGTRNINMPQSQPAGNLLDYVNTVVRANMMHILNSEEKLFMYGDAAAGTAPARRDAMPTDAAYLAGYPVSLQAILYSSGTVTPHATADLTDESFAAIKVDDVAKWEAKHQVAAATNHTTLIADLQKTIMSTTYSEEERPTDVYVSADTFEVFLSLMRASGALPDPVRANLGLAGTIPFGGITIDWSRYLNLHIRWDTLHAEETTPTYPIVGINWNSLRLNTVRQGSISGQSGDVGGGGQIGFINQIGAMQTHPVLTNVFKRIEWKRQWSCDKGRRSFFSINGNLTLA